MEASSVLTTYSQRCPRVLEDGNHDWNSQYFWDFLTKPDRVRPQSRAAYEETVVEVDRYEETDDVVSTHFVHNFEESKVANYEDTEVEDTTNTHFVNEMEMDTNYANDVEVHHDTESLDDTEVHIDPDYVEFKEAMESRKLRRIEESIDYHPEALTLKLFPKHRTALHYVLEFMEVDIAKYLVGRMSPEDLEIQDSEGFTPLALAAQHDHPRIVELLRLMLNKNPKLVQIGSLQTIPVIVASNEGSLVATRFLCNNYTDISILSKEDGRVGLTLLLNCIYYKLFDLAHDIVETYPTILLTCDDDNDERKFYPIPIFAQAFGELPRNVNCGDYSLFGCWSPSLEETIFDEDENDDEARDARRFLRLVCGEVRRFTVQELKDAVYDAMIIATQNGTIEFITEMLAANKSLIWAKVKEKSMFLYAIEYRQEEVFSIIYKYRNYKDLLLKVGEEDDGNVLHLVAKSPPPLLDLDSSSFLHMQREVKWFKGVAKLAKRQYRYDGNSEGSLPAALFFAEHKELITKGMESMKGLANAASLVGALIITAMFAALFTTPGGTNDQAALGFPFKFYVIFDALSLFSSATSVLVFLGILSSSFSSKDFDYKLPKKLLIGYATLFFSITTMMLTFCTALTIMFDGEVLFIAPIVLLSIVPVLFFSSSVCPLLGKIYKSTYEPSIFDGNTSDDIYLPYEEEEGKVKSYSYSVDKMV